MMQRSPRKLLVLLVPLCLQICAGAQGGAAPSDGELKGLAASLSAYFEARANALGTDEARAAIATQLVELSGQGSGAHPLRRNATLGRALWLSRRYEKAKLRKGKVTTETFEGGSFADDALEYAYRVPRDYDPRTGSYPLILAIPDEEQRPADHIREDWSSSEFRDGAIVVCAAMPAERAEWDRVMVSGRPGGLIHVLTALRLAEERFAVDPERVFVAGRGKGVPAAVAAGNYSPQRFAGVIGRAGDTGPLGPDNFSNLPTYFLGAGGEAAAFQRAAREAGFDNCDLESVGKELDVWSWMHDRRRDSYPSSVELVVGKPFPTRAYWLRVAPIAPDAHASATIDRERNTIRIDSEGVSHATLYLNDELVQLESPLRVVLNGVEQSSDVLRHLPTTLDLLVDGTSDAACVYVAQGVYDMRAGAAAATPGAAASEDEEFEAHLEAAGDDVEELWELQRWCADSAREALRLVVLRRIVRLAPDHEAARAALGHRQVAGHWFTSAAAAERFERTQDEETALARGYVEHKGLWMHPRERALASKGLTKDPQSGQWLSAADRGRLKDGWVRQGLEWIAPEDAARVDRGLWRVDGEWLGLARANERHSRIDAPWVLPSAEVLLRATVERDVARRALENMSRAIDDLRHVFGAEPPLPLSVVVLRNEEQYDRFAFGDPDGRRPPTDAGRLHVIHSAYFAESWFPRVAGSLEFAGAGVCYWDALAPGGDLYGVHSARLAVGLSYVDALDPSPKAVRRALSKGLSAGYYEAYRAEKKLPAWLRYGGAVYAERYFRDDTVAQGGDPWWARNWSLDNLRSRDGLRDLREVFEFQLDPEDRDDSLKLLLEAGLLVAYLVDGECAELDALHDELQQALRSGSPRPKQLALLEQTLLAHEDELRAFAGI